MKRMFMVSLGVALVACGQEAPTPSQGEMPAHEREAAPPVDAERAMLRARAQGIFGELPDVADSSENPITDEALLESPIWSKLGSIYIVCGPPSLRLTLTDKRGQPVSVSWVDDSAQPTVREIATFVHDWRNPLQLLCHSFLFLGLPLLIVWLASLVSVPLGSTTGSTATAPTGPSATSGWLWIWVVIGLVVGAILASLGPVRRCLDGLADQYSRLFPACYFAFKSTRHLQRGDAVRWIAILIYVSCIVYLGRLVIAFLT